MRGCAQVLLGTGEKNGKLDWTGPAFGRETRGHFLDWRMRASTERVAGRFLV